MECLEKDKQFQEFKKYTDNIKYDFNDVKEAYETLSRSIKMIKKESVENDKATKLFKETDMEKQMEINIHLDTIASLKKELELMRIEKERVDKKLISYISSSYKSPDGVEAALNLKLGTVENELPENIDVTFSPSDTDNESQVIKTIVEQVLDEESDNSDFGTVKTHLENSNSDSEDDGNFLDKFIPKSDKVVNDDSIMVAYTMSRTDRLYTDFEFPIQNAKLENVEKVFKLVEIDISEVNNNAFLSKSKKSFVKQQPNNPGKKEWMGNNGYNKRHGNNSKKKGVSFEKKMAKKEVKPKEKLSDVFVAGKNTVAEKDYIFSQKAVDDFNAAKKLKDETNRSTFVEYDKRVCYHCNEIGHMAKQCVKEIEKPVFQKPKPKISNDVKGKTTMVPVVRILKRDESLKSEDKPKSTFEIGESSKTQKTSKVYPKTKIFPNQSWVEKPKQSFEEEKMKKVLKSEVVVTNNEKFEFELNKLIEEFPPIKEETLKSKYVPEVPNVIFNLLKVDQVACDLVFGASEVIISKWIMDSGASRHMTEMLALLYDVKSINRGYVGFAGTQGGRIVREGILTNGVVTFDKVNYIIELENNLLSISQICDKSFIVHFTKNECLIIKPGFKIPEDMLLMRAPRENDLYVLDMSVATTSDKKPKCFVTITKATEKESRMWHRKMGHIHVREMNFLVHNDLVEGVNLKHLNDVCVECKKGKQMKNSHRKKLLNSIILPLERLHMDRFGPVHEKSVSGDLYSLVLTDDYTRFSWVMCL
ncbi:uncharacterized protein LOC110925068 [Helianthus annuus]|uniref:uncharacterized protein LOC110925068 n=1 Tax=Helianthus annuus TaxID=4232 RepID=UPI000B90A479|nr:uncharacterized protein LOC110925068 [Helianthus annuus]